MTSTADLRAAAQAATPGPLEIRRYEHGGGRLAKGNTLIADLYREGDREFYSLASPDRILGLLDRVNRLEGALDRIEVRAQGLSLSGLRVRPEAALTAIREEARAALAAREPAPSSMKGEE